MQHAHTQGRRLRACLSSTGSAPIETVDLLNVAPWESGVPIVRSTRLVTRRRGPFWSDREGALWDGRWVLALMMVASLLMSTLGPAAPVGAAPSPDPAARLQIVIKNIRINNDRDGWARGSGELTLFTRFCPMSDSYDPCTGQDGVLSQWDFSADSGEDVKPNLIIPWPGSEITLYGDASYGGGEPVYSGRNYAVRFSMLEHDDDTGDQNMGEAWWGLYEADNWSVGEHTQGSDSHSDGAAWDHPDFVVTFEIRRAPLQDPLLQQPLQLVTSNATGLAICGVIDNIGEMPSTPMPLTIRANEAVVRQLTVPALAVGQSVQQCINRSELPPQQIGVTFTLDEARQIPEMHEDYNSSFVTVPALAATGGTDPTRPVPAPSPEPKPTGEKPDLSVKAIRLKGQEAGAKISCAAGPNSVVVRLKNNGKGDAGSFTVRLVVDGDDRDTTVEGVPAGEEHEVAFDNVPLKKGEHTLKAIADPDHAVSEGKDDNNSLKVSARCTEAAS
jgi:hypothetical protein